MPSTTIRRQNLMPAHLWNSFTIISWLFCVKINSTTYLFLVLKIISSLHILSSLNRSITSFGISLFAWNSQIYEQKTRKVEICVILCNFSEFQEMLRAPWKFFTSLISNSKSAIFYWEVPWARITTVAKKSH